MAKKKGPAQPDKRCRICRAPAVGIGTEEHIIPQWLRKLTLEELETFPPELVKPTWRQWSKVVLKPVCQPCQRRLNEVFEDPASDLLKAMVGETCILTPRRQALVAAWLAKTEFLFILYRETNGPPDWKLERPQLFEEARLALIETMLTGTPPPDTTARIAKIGDETPKVGWVLPGEPPNHETVATSGVSSISPLFTAEFIAWSDEAAMRRHLSTNQDRRFITVWPPDVSNRRWPPPELLSPNDVSILREQLGHSGELVGTIPLEPVDPSVFPGYPEPPESTPE